MRIGGEIMAHEIGGRSDKSGNRFEHRWVIYQLLAVLEEKINYVVIEAIGDDEKGADLHVCKKDNIIEFQQCKSRNRSHDYWDYGALNAKNVFDNWLLHLHRNAEYDVSLVSPSSFTLLGDLCKRARNTTSSVDDFYKFQLVGKDNIDLANKLRRKWGISEDTDTDKSCFINYLSRVHLHQWHEDGLKDVVFDKLEMLFVCDAQAIYNALFTWAVDSIQWAKEINVTVIQNMLNQHGFILRDLAKDQKIAPTITNLNRHYRDYYPTLSGGFINRAEFTDCEKWIRNGESIIVHGKAGSGKSGCAQYIASFCENNSIPYVAVGLDKRPPSKNPESWGEELGLPSSVAHCINSISKNQNAVIILDQLDALRWTAAHSRDALLVCSDIIRQVKNINYDRKKNISLVLVCRTIDLRHDTKINSLFHNKEDDNAIEWHEFEVGDFSDTQLQELVGIDVYKRLSSRLQQLLKTPSNLYIWQRLESDEKYTDCTTLSNLIFKWWSELCTKCAEQGISIDSLNAWKDDFVRLSEMHRKNEVSEREMTKYTGDNGIVNFLRSCGILKSEKAVSLVHQSIWDCFIAEKMRELANANCPVIEIVGAKEHQTPMKRYQIQLLLQDLLDFAPNSFLSFGHEMINSPDIRYMIKSVFFEVFSQISHPNGDIANAIIKHSTNDTLSQQFINNVLFAQPEFTRVLMRAGILDDWMQDEAKRDTAIRLVCNIRQACQSEEISFIHKYASFVPEHINSFSWCFTNNIAGDSDELFELRMELYLQYPEMFTHNYFDLDKAFNTHPLRCTRLLALAIKIKAEEQIDATKRIKKMESVFGDGFVPISRAMLDLLLSILPTNPEDDRNWSGEYDYDTKLERFCLALIIELGSDVAKNDSDEFWCVFGGFLHTGRDIHNEIILSCLLHMSADASDKVINYLCIDFNKTIFEKSSGNKDKLALAKAVIREHSMQCSPATFNLLEQAIVGYKFPRAKQYLEYRMSLSWEYRMQRGRDNGFDVYHSIWGDLQHELLSVLPINRISPSTNDLMSVLGRKFPNGTTSYKHYTGHSGGMSSPVSGKNLSNKQWLRLIFNDKIQCRDRSKSWIEVPGGFVESSIEQYSSDFNRAVSAEPERFIKLLLDQKKEIPPPYIRSLFSGIASIAYEDKDSTNRVAIGLLEKVILTFANSAASVVAWDVCRIIQNRYKDNWSPEIIDLLISIATTDEPPTPTTYVVTHPRAKDENENSFAKLSSESYNNTSGRALLAMARLLYEHESLVTKFKPIIEKLVANKGTGGLQQRLVYVFYSIITRCFPASAYNRHSIAPNAAIQLAAFDAVYSFWNYDRDWVLKTTIAMITCDHRLAGYDNAGQLLFRVYDHLPSHRQAVLGIFKKCYYSDDELLVKKGAAWVTEAYICFNEFANIFANLNTVSKVQAEAMLSMAIVYFDISEYSNIAKELCSRFMATPLDLQDRISRLFYDKKINLERDRDFIANLVCSKYANRVFYLLAKYLKDNAVSLYDYRDIIFAACSHLLKNNHNNGRARWDFASEISSAVVGLYDETASTDSPDRQTVAQKCLDIWDTMFERQIGDARKIMNDIADR